MDSAEQRIRDTLDEVKSLLSREPAPRLSEADTKANFIEPVIQALGWSGIGVVTREYHVKNSGEFIDYVMFGPSGHLLAIEAKSLQTDLSDKYAAQLIQYCSVEGIEWAALTNGRELQFFNTFLRPDLPAKRIFSIDLLAYDTDEEFDALVERVRLLSRESMTSPAGLRAWLNRWRLDKEMRSLLLDPNSPTVRQLRKALADAEIRVTTQDLVRWFGARLGSPVAAAPTGGRSIEPPPSVTHAPVDQPDATATPAGKSGRTSTHYGVSVRDLIDAGLLAPGTQLTLHAGNRDVATATVREDGQIVWNGVAYRSLSDRAFGPLLGPTRWTLNGWAHWHAPTAAGSEPLADVRERFLHLQEAGHEESPN